MNYWMLTDLLSVVEVHFFVISLIVGGWFSFFFLKRYSQQRNLIYSFHSVRPPSLVPTGYFLTNGKETGSTSLYMQLFLCGLISAVITCAIIAVHHGFIIIIPVVGARYEMIKRAFARWRKQELKLWNGGLDRSGFVSLCGKKLHSQLLSRSKHSHPAARRSQETLSRHLVSSADRTHRLGSVLFFCNQSLTHLNADDGACVSVVCVGTRAVTADSVCVCEGTTQSDCLKLRF